MQHAALGPLRVSRIALGTMLMGGRTPRDEAHRMLDTYLAAGGNFLDTADVYGDGTSGETLPPGLARRRGVARARARRRRPRDQARFRAVQARGLRPPP